MSFIVFCLASTVLSGWNYHQNDLDNLFKEFHEISKRTWRTGIKSWTTEEIQMDPWLGTWHNFHQPSYYNLALNLRNHPSKFQNSRTTLLYASKETKQLLIDFGANIENDDDDSTYTITWRTFWKSGFLVIIKQCFSSFWWKNPHAKVKNDQTLFDTPRQRVTYEQFDLCKVPDIVSTLSWKYSSTIKTVSK